MLMRVKPGGSCMNMHRKQMVAGTVFEAVPRTVDNAYGEKQVPKDVADDWVRNGYAEPLNHGQHSDADPLDLDTQRHRLPGIPMAKDEKGDLYTPEILVDQEGVKQKPYSTRDRIEIGSTPTTAISPWTFDPNSLQDKSLDDLNAMIFDRLQPEDQKQFGAYQSPAEAIRHLSQNWESPGRAAQQQAPTPAAPPPGTAGNGG